MQAENRPCTKCQTRPVDQALTYAIIALLSILAIAAIAIGLNAGVSDGLRAVAAVMQAEANAATASPAEVVFIHTFVVPDLAIKSPFPADKPSEDDTPAQDEGCTLTHPMICGLNAQMGRSECVHLITPALITHQ